MNNNSRLKKPVRRTPNIRLLARPQFERCLLSIRQMIRKSRYKR